MKYIKKPVEVEAVQWDGKNTEEVRRLTSNAAKLKNGQIQVPTAEGKITASVGDYIIKENEGELYICKPDVFREAYSGVEGCTFFGKKVKAEIVTECGKTRLCIDGKEIENILKLYFSHNPMKNKQPELYYTAEIDVFKQ